MRERIYLRIALAALIIMSSVFFSNAVWAWTSEGHWQEGDSITWDVPYQSQKTLRNWTCACMPTSAAMVVNFFYGGAQRSQFVDVNDQNHPWNPVSIKHP